jgi:hypothetical protein
MVPVSQCGKHLVGTSQGARSVVLAGFRDTEDRENRIPMYFSTVPPHLNI